MKNRLTSGLALVAAITLIGCGGGGSDDTVAETGYFIDSPVDGLAYRTASGMTGKTDEFGRFQYRYDERIEFRIGNLILGEAVPSTGGLITPEVLFPSDEPHKLLLLQTLQALDTDHNLSNGITLPENLLEEIDPVSFSDLNESQIIALNNGELAELIDTDYDGQIDIDPTQAQTHFMGSIDSWDNGHRPDENTSGNGYRHGGTFGGSNGTGVDISTLPSSTLTQELKDALAYMGNEERLAYDIYMNLYNYHSANGDRVSQLQNIASRSEQSHVGIVQSLVQKYDLTAADLDNVQNGIADNTVSFSDMPSGQYDIPAIQSLYDALYAKGTDSVQDALEVGCMVEVTDINDLDHYLSLAAASNAEDVQAAFEVLRDGSYKHYWAFDKGLKNRGVSEGCCSLGTIDGINYCHNKYPQN